MIEVFLIVLMAYIVAVVFHELGHYFYAINLNRVASITFCKDRGKPRLYTDYEGAVFTNKEYKWYFLTGVISGGVWLMIASLIFPVVWFLLPAYMWGCRKDLREVKNASR